MFDITELYYNEQFNNLLVLMANKKQIIDFDDFRQDVFLEIIDNGCKSMKACKTVANRIAKRYYDIQKETDIMNMAYIHEDGSIETEDEVMGRLVYHNKAVYV